jgi:outer membrane protein OmpA-like peptidoglycan-associated protein
VESGRHSRTKCAVLAAVREGEDEMYRVLVLGGLALAILLVLCPQVRGPAIEADILERTQAAVTSAGFAGARVVVDGRDVTLQGTVASTEQRGEAGQAAAAVRGVRVVDNQLATGAARVGVGLPASLEATVRGMRVALRGRVPNADILATLLRDARDVFGDLSVSGDLSVDGALDGRAWPTSFTDIFEAFHGRGAEIDLSARDGLVVVEGTVLSELEIERITGALRTALPDTELDIRLRVREPRNDREALQARLDAALRGKNIEFASDGAELTPVGQAVVDEVYDLIVDTDVKLVITGHTDAQNTPEYNLALSERRAAAVRDTLIERGIDPSRLYSAGFGESRPIASNDTPEGRQDNRRTEFHILGED